MYVCRPMGHEKQTLLSGDRDSLMGNLRLCSTAPVQGGATEVKKFLYRALQVFIFSHLWCSLKCLAYKLLLVLCESPRTMDA